MLRAVRFEAKLGFTIHESARAPFAPLAGLSSTFPPARLLDEFQKLFLAGFGRRFFRPLREHGLLEHCSLQRRSPRGTRRRHGAGAHPRGLANTDQRVAEGRRVTPMFLFAVMLFGPGLWPAQRRFESGMHPGVAIAEAVDEVVGQQNRRIGIPKRFSIPMRECSRFSLASTGATDGRALGFLRNTRAFARRTTSCCCGPKRAPKIPEIARVVDRAADTDARNSSASAWAPTRRRAGGPARVRRRRRRRARAPSTARKTPRTERRMAWTPAYVALGSNLSGPRRQV
jgi:poly(A) polymerase